MSQELEFGDPEEVKKELKQILKDDGMDSSDENVELMYQAITNSDQVSMFEKLLKGFGSDGLGFGEDSDDEAYEGYDRTEHINFILKNDNDAPEYTSNGNSGFDLRSAEDTELAPGEFKAISTGLFIELPEGLELQVRPRSGLALKNGITVLNSPGTVDASYRGEIKAILINHSKETFKISKNDRIAQCVIAEVITKNSITFVRVNELSESDRNDKGFGSSGVK